ncbi:MAG: CCA tRNA nucleotidyltransferase [Sphingobium sp.]|nr:CCA tRNA nucleotidyltransferase [Sphingobium sp.]
MPERLPDAEWRARSGLARLCAVLGAGEGQARFVGGAVRDGLLGIPVKDVDIATVHLPEAVVERVTGAGFKAVPTGIAHGTVTAVVHGWPVEITTLRRDVSTDGRRATVAFGTDWREDAARRDFTMNALYADPVDGTLFDYFGGLDDLAAHRVRFIGDPHARIGEDHLRILRYFRFTARFGTVDRASADYRACVDRATSLMALSRERIADELFKLLALPDPSGVVAAMIEDRIFQPVLPEIGIDGLAVLQRLVAAEQATGTEPDALRRLLALLPPDAAVADQVAARLRLSNKARVRMTAALTPRDTPHARGLVYGIGTAAAMDQILLGRAFDLAQLADIVDWTPPRLPLSGGNLIGMGLEPGPQVARALQALEKQWVAAGFPGEAETRALADQILVSWLRLNQ